VPSFVFTKNQTMEQCFCGCQNLRELPIFNTSTVSNMVGFAENCANLKSVPAYNYANVTSMANAFRYSPIESFADIIAPKCTSFRTMFEGSHLIFANIVQSNVACNYEYLFQACSFLVSTKTLDLDLSTSNLASVYTNNQARLKTIFPLNVRYSINVASTGLNVENLVRLFNALVTATGRTVTITNSAGASLLTTEQRAIATNKGWTIVG